MQFKYGVGGALLCDLPIEGITDELFDETRKSYGARYIIAESMSRLAAEKISKLLGGTELIDMEYSDVILKGSLDE